MEVTIAEAGARIAELIRAVKAGEQVLITDEGKPVAEISPAPGTEWLGKRKIQLGWAKDEVKLLPGWDDPIDLDRFLAGGL